MRLQLSVLFERAIPGAEVARALSRAHLAERFDPASPTLVIDGVNCTLALHHGRADATAAHTFFIRLSSVEEHEPPLVRLCALSRLAAPLLGLPGSVALWADDAQALTDAQTALARLEALRGPVAPIDLWIALRTFPLADAAGSFMDTLGMAQLGHPDFEAYASDALPDGQTAAWLRNLTLYLVQNGPPLHTGDTLDGPDEQPWAAQEDFSTVEPHRKVVRLRRC